jgi:nitroreductase
MTDTTLSFKSTVRARKSVRKFLSRPVPDEIIAEVLEDAQLAPSNSNTQPWNVHIISGEKLRVLSGKLFQELAAGKLSPDFSFDTKLFYGRYKERSDEQGRSYHESIGIARADDAARRAAGALNYSFFNAPHVALLFMPSFGDNVRVAADVGMYGQTLLLALAARGLAGVPQTSLGFMAGTMREFVGVSSEFKFLFGISFGYADDSEACNRMPSKRDPVAGCVTFHK